MRAALPPPPPPPKKKNIENSVICTTEDPVKLRQVWIFLLGELDIFLFPPGCYRIFSMACMPLPSSA